MNKTKMSAQGGSASGGKNFIHNLKWLTLSIAMGIAIGGGLIAVKAWTEPTQAPPGGNIGAPINTGITGQSKSGGLVLNTGGAANGLIVQGGNVGIGTATPGQKLTVSGGDLQVETGQGRFKSWRSSGATGRALEVGISSGTGYIYNYDPQSNTHGDIVLGGFDFRVKADGNVGIGTASPSTGLRLDVEGKVGATEYCDQDGNNCKAITAMGGGSTKAWVNFNGNSGGSIRRQFNVSSILRESTGNYRVNWQNPFADTNYAFFITTSAGGGIRLTEITSTYLRFQLFSISASPALTDTSVISVVAIDN